MLMLLFLWIATIVCGFFAWAWASSAMGVVFPINPTSRVKFEKYTQIIFLLFFAFWSGLLFVVSLTCLITEIARRWLQ